jgi:hypothetical protein
LLPGGRFQLDPAVPAGTEAAAKFGWPLLFADEFDGAALNPITWQPTTAARRVRSGSAARPTSPSPTAR